MTALHQKIWICLCEPSDIRNIGGAIRVVANFGLAGLKLVISQDRQLPLDELELFSSGAASIITLERHHSLVEATENADLLIGTSRRQRSHAHLAEYQTYDLPEILAQSERPHILFGNERVGLSHHELDLCHALAVIHSNPSFPSLNLAHAVACVAYEISRPQPSLSEESLTQLPLRPSQTHSKEDEAFLNRVIEVCERCSYPPSSSPEHFARRLRSLIRKADPTPGDYGMILGLFRELDRLNSLANVESK